LEKKKIEKYWRRERKKKKWGNRSIKKRKREVGIVSLLYRMQAVRGTRIGRDLVLSIVNICYAISLALLSGFFRNWPIGWSSLLIT
jgi:hypothetical protein